MECNAARVNGRCQTEQHRSRSENGARSAVSPLPLIPSVINWGNSTQRQPLDFIAAVRALHGHSRGLGACQRHVGLGGRESGQAAQNSGDRRRRLWKGEGIGGWTEIGTWGRNVHAGQNRNGRGAPGVNLVCVVQSGHCAVSPGVHGNRRVEGCLAYRC